MPPERAQPEERTAADSLNETSFVSGQPALPAAQPDPAPDPTEVSSALRQIGHYRLVRLLGHGGMGEVWLAEQTHPVRRQVALKLMRAGPNTEDLASRFESERQALAMMEHPAIARVFDAGSTPEGEPYFVMERVDGLPITNDCDRLALPIAERVKVFIRACEGVQHAHQKAVIHRDLKPSNVLVAELDGQRLVKIIDFGLAKAMGSALPGAIVTQAGMAVGTPLYMSPEQTKSDEGGLDTRTDVYSLGVILYELLVGVTPFDGSTLTYDQLLRAIREEDVPRPSVRFLRLPEETRQSVAGARSMQVASLQKQLSGDLDWIVMRALERERERRYSTPSELAADLARWLRHEPVTARPPSAAYRTRKFVRRHRAGVTFALSIAVLLIAFGVVMGIQAARIARERDRARRNEAIAERNRSEATKQAQVALGTIYDIVTRNDEGLRKLPGTAQLRKERLEAAMKSLDEISRTAATSSWADRTMGVALQRMAQFYSNLGLGDGAEEYRRSLKIFERLMKEDPDQDWTAFDATISYDGLGELGRETDPDPTKIMALYERSRRLRERLIAQPHQSEPSMPVRIHALSVSYIKLADLSLTLHQPTQAQVYAGAGLRYAGRLNPADPELSSGLHRSLGRSRTMVGDERGAREALDEAENEEGLWMRKEPANPLPKQEHARTALAIGDLELGLGRTNAALDRYRTAEAAFRALAERDKANLELQWYIANAEYALGRALRVAGQTGEARRAFQESQKRREMLLSKDPANVQRKIERMLGRAELAEDQGAVADAREVERYAPHHPGKLFEAATAYARCHASQAPGSARDGYGEEAIRLLTAAFQSGFRDPWTLEHAPEWQALRGDPRFDRLLEQIRRAPTPPA